MSDTHPIDGLFATVSARKDADPVQSYTAKLLAGGANLCAKKFGEEAVETALAAVSGEKSALVSESADVLFHLLVLWAACGVTPEDVYATLRTREGQSGLAEKASRPKG